MLILHGVVYDSLASREDNSPDDVGKQLIKPTIRVKAELIIVAPKHSGYTKVASLLSRSIGPRTRARGARVLRTTHGGHVACGEEKPMGQKTRKASLLQVQGHLPCQGCEVLGWNDSKAVRRLHRQLCRAAYTAHPRRIGNICADHQWNMSLPKTTARSRRYDMI